MSSHFNCIGFPVDNMDEYWALARRVAAEGIRLPVPGGGALVRFELPQGPQVWAQIDPGGEIAGITPFFATGAPHRLAITGIGEDPEEPLDGWIDGWLEPRENDEPYSGAFPLRTSLVDFAVVRNRITTFPTLGRVDIAALASEAELHKNEEAYRTAPGEIYRPPAESFASAAHASIDDTPAFQEPTALVSDAGVRSRRERFRGRTVDLPGSGTVRQHRRHACVSGTDCAGQRAADPRANADQSGHRIPVL